jgi:DNA-binding CsgD family transcriptional regulator
MTNLDNLDAAAGREPSPGTAAVGCSWPDKPTSAWVRWLVACDVPPAHIALLLGAPEASVRAYLDRPAGRWITPGELERMRAMRAGGKTFAEIGREIGRNQASVWAALKRGVTSRQPTAPPPRYGGGGNAILGKMATKIRRLAALDYPPARIAAILGVDIAEVRSFLARTEPVRRAHLVRPRMKSEHARMVRNQRRRPPPKPKPYCPAPDEEWRYVNDVGPDGTVELLTIAAAELVDHQAAVELPPATVEARPAPNVWVGSASAHATGEAHGSAKLTQAKADEIRELHAAGRSIYSLAPEFGVSKSAIRAIVRRETWAEL